MPCGYVWKNEQAESYWRDKKKNPKNKIIPEERNWGTEEAEYCP